MSNADWYARKMGAQKPQQSSPPSSPPAPMRYTPQQRQEPNVPVTYDPSEDQLVTRAQSARESDMCPGCMSGNYFAPLGTQRKRCYDCGYPIVQQGSGLSSSGTGNGTVKAARQVGQEGGFNPTTIVDRIG